MTLRVPREIERKIQQEARRRKRTKSAVLREVIEAALAGATAAEDPAAEARRQSLLVSGRRSEKDALRFIEGAADVRGWR
jgi:predicted flap endonuclease-1-like 5' DNA nuclease